ncbi:MAG: PHB depolymerase family esterase [Pseudomonadota bacterium]
MVTMLTRLFAALALVAVAARADAFESSVLRLVHDGEEREALIDAPRDARNAPVLVVLHGGLAGAQTVRRRARVGLAREGWVVLWPSALDDWNDGRVDRRGRPYDEADDIGFLRRLIHELAAAGIADPNRVFFAGPSIGGIMALRMLCEAPDLAAGVAVAIASFPEGSECREGPARPILYIHGTADEIVPPEGGRIGGDSPFVRDRGRVRPVDETLAALARRNGCAGVSETALPNRSQSDGSTVVLREYRGCEAPLVHYVVEGGGHTWPGSAASGLGRRIVGETNQDISATRIVEAFFKALAERSVD